MSYREKAARRLAGEIIPLGSLEKHSVPPPPQSPCDPNSDKEQRIVGFL